MCFVFLMIRRPPRSTRTDTLFPYTALYGAVGIDVIAITDVGLAGRTHATVGGGRCQAQFRVAPDDNVDDIAASDSISFACAEQELYVFIDAVAGGFALLGN